MKIAVLGGGFAGLAAAHYLTKKGHQVTLIEKASVLGGLAVGFKAEGWDWPLERAYHHLFASDKDILGLAEDVGFDQIFFRSVHSDSLYKVKNDYRIFPVDTPQDFLRFPLLPLVDKVRGAAVLAFLRFSPHLKLFDQITAEEFCRRYMGSKMWEVFIQDLFRKKFVNYAEKILTSWLWSRTVVRTKQLGYIRGGFQTFVEYLEKTLGNEGVTIKKNTTLELLRKKDNLFSLQLLESSNNRSTETFDVVVSTLPSPILNKVGEKVLPNTYLSKLKNLEYLSALVIILETDKPILPTTYWLNICAPDIPIMFVGQHTNFIDKKYYGGKNLAYAANYLRPDDPLLKQSDEEVAKHYISNIEKVTRYKLPVTRYWIFRAPFAQPVFDKNFLKNKPDFITPTKNFYVANLDMTYPYDRGTNYAVRLGRQVAEMI